MGINITVVGHEPIPDKIKDDITQDTLPYSMVTVLIVDDDEEIRALVNDTLDLSPQADFHVIEAANGDEAVNIVLNENIDVVLLDISLPGDDGASVAKKLLKIDSKLRILVHTGHGDQDSILKMMISGACGYLVKGEKELAKSVLLANSGEKVVNQQAMPGLIEALLTKVREAKRHQASLEKAHGELETNYKETVLSLAEALRTRDRETQSHVDRVTSLSLEIGRAMGLGAKALQDLEYGAIFHDIGKLGVPDNILHGEGDLSPEEWEIIREHTIIGERILHPIRYLQGAARIVRGHHENWDGTGYPDQLHGEEIPLQSRIIRVADSFDAMSSNRTYQTGRSEDIVLQRLKELSGSAFDPYIIETLLRLKGEVTEDESAGDNQ